MGSRQGWPAAGGRRAARWQVALLCLLSLARRPRFTRCARPAAAPARRAAHPGNLRGKLVSSAALLTRLLPLVQLLLMRFLYFAVRPC